MCQAIAQCRNEVQPNLLAVVRPNHFQHPVIDGEKGALDRCSCQWWMKHGADRAPGITQAVDISSIRACLHCVNFLTHLYNNAAGIRIFRRKSFSSCHAFRSPRGRNVVAGVRVENPTAVQTRWDGGHWSELNKQMWCWQSLPRVPHHVLPTASESPAGKRQLIFALWPLLRSALSSTAFNKNKVSKRAHLHLLPSIYNDWSSKVLGNRCWIGCL